MVKLVGRRAGGFCGCGLLLIEMLVLCESYCALFVRWVGSRGIPSCVAGSSSEADSVWYLGCGIGHIYGCCCIQVWGSIVFSV